MTTWQAMPIDCSKRFCVAVEDVRADGKPRRCGITFADVTDLPRVIASLQSWLAEKRAEDAAWLARKAHG